MDLDLKVHSRCLMKPCVKKKINVLINPLKGVLRSFEGARFWKGLILSSLKRLIRSYFQSSSLLIFINTCARYNLCLNFSCHRAKGPRSKRRWPNG